MYITLIKPGFLTKREVKKRMVFDLALIYFSVRVTIFLYKYLGIIVTKKKSGFNQF